MCDSFLRPLKQQVNQRRKGPEKPGAKKSRCMAGEWEGHGPNPQTAALHTRLRHLLRASCCCVVQGGVETAKLVPSIFFLIESISDQCGRGVQRESKE